MPCIKAIIENSKAVYTPEDTVSGYLIADFTTATHVREVSVSLNCSTIVEIAFMFSGSWEHPLSETLNFKMDSRVFPPNDMPTQRVYTFPPGRHVWPFSFPLAAAGPLLLPTCKGRNDKNSKHSCFYGIHCSVDAVLLRKSIWKPIVRHTVPLQVMPTTDISVLESSLAMPTFVKRECRFGSGKTFTKFKNDNQTVVPVRLGALVPLIIAPSPRRPDLQFFFCSSSPLHIRSITVYLRQAVEVSFKDLNFKTQDLTRHGVKTQKIEKGHTHLDLSKALIGFEFENTLPTFSSNVIRCKHSIVFEVCVSETKGSRNSQVLKLEVPVEVASSYEEIPIPTYAEASVPV
ncbi:hypothetical protein B9G98_04385 [Wickerhamiella sorbophila]|uniref:Arrestin-like N-terminal domain-containing protein n=1 Tax=Wickerhamiella sorbophila TaxID=45607 RepID=A0A2T0FP56_9ASCO|nr:hypothetical protein B9G98_04385 [Wickerhamiella sorbophila]PRT56765.1 hypothetical protein B9G98_04385 [Wickerhamiella sorbophila]